MLHFSLVFSGVIAMKRFFELFRCEIKSYWFLEFSPENLKQSNFIEVISGIIEAITKFKNMESK